MNTAKVYTAPNGEELTIHQMVRSYPLWAARTIQEGEAAQQRIAELDGEITELRAFAYGGPVNANDLIDHLRQVRSELEAERDDYRERWEQTGCTRHVAMESAIKLAESYRQQLDDRAAERDRLIDELRDAEARNAQKLSEIARLREALRMAADELESYYCAEYPCADSYPSQARKLALAIRSNPARAALESGDE